MVKKFLDYLATNSLFSYFDNFISYLYVINKECKDTNITYRINKIVNLINQIKQAMSLLFQEVRNLRNDMAFLHNERKNKVLLHDERKNKYSKRR